MLFKYEDDTKACEKVKTRDVRNKIQRDETSHIILNENKCKVLHRATTQSAPA